MEFRYRYLQSHDWALRPQLFLGRQEYQIHNPHFISRIRGVLAILITEVVVFKLLKIIFLARPPSIGYEYWIYRDYIILSSKGG